MRTDNEIKRKPMVSVIMPTYNRADVVGASVQSVLSQSFTDLELIVWNDGSTDSTPQTISTHRDSRLVFSGGPNRGQAAARNSAIRLSSARYIALIDDDDTWMPEKLQLQIDFMERYRSIDILFTDFENLNAATGRSTPSFPSNREIFDLMRIEHPVNDIGMITGGFMDAYIRRDFILPSSVMFRRAVWERIGDFNENFRGTEDFEYWFRCALADCRFAFIRKILVKRVKGSDSFTAGGARTLEEMARTQEHCVDLALKSDRGDLVPLLYKSVGKTLEGAIKVYGIAGNRIRALSMFARRFSYGCSTRAVALALSALMGPWIFRLFGSRPEPAQEFSPE